MSVPKMFIKFIFLFTIFPLLIFYSDNLFAQSEWKTPIFISFESWQETLYFGVHPNGSNIFDVGLDTLSPPPGFGPYAYFTILTFPNYLLTDIRNPQDSITWQLKTTNCTDKTVKIKWDLRNLNLTANETIEILGYLKMTGLDSLSVTGDVSLEIKYSNLTSSDIKNDILNNQKLVLISAYPNPFNKEITFSVDLKTKSYVRIDIVNISGKFVTKLFDGYLTSGNHKVHWNGTNDDKYQIVATGIYYCCLLLNNQVFNHKILFLK